MSDHQLAWRDTFVKLLVQELTTEPCDGSVVLLDTDYNLIMLELTEEEWTKLFSCIMNGSDLTYGLESHQIVWSWLKGVECAMSFCSKMIECFENDEDTREAMIQALISELLADPVQAEAFVSAMRQLGIGVSGGNNQIGAPNSELSSKEQGNCDDLDVLYGQCLAWVSALNIIAEDVFEWVELATNDEELASLLADNIPGIGAIPASALEFALWLQDTVRETYLSAYDTTSQEYWACKIYCEVVNDDCILNFEHVHNAYVNELTAFTPPTYSDDLTVWLEWYVEQVTLSDNEVVGIMHLFIMTVLERLGSIFGSTFRTIEIALADADPIEANCPCCADIYLDFADDTTATAVYAEGGISGSTVWQANGWAVGEGAWRAGTQFFVDGGDPSRFGFLQIAVDPDCYYTGFSVEMQITDTGGGTSNFTVALYDTNIIPRLADNEFVLDVVSANTSFYHTFANSFSPRTFPDGYVVIGFGTGGHRDDWIARIKYFQLFN